ncbi:nitrate/sulfonate/bicarbonate ABC transporter ATPase [Alcanivorax sp. S71-1-4]|jgi:NitT/TauT family transport system ATP-binding protein|uniref:ABC transporter ATP-binding protein n=1 Tax=Alcanivorax sp. S71-1-4 TaxID=1177159 RepID=UPI00135ADD9D|nr:ABC transporter ATP-binding protein [Alcanivorax sp. S71-1-4]KAF0810661.1 nitrate/sulfonate/bicarbonate ABC transporter ATPase [Alcanivorax sp. S71-1-4]
MNAYAASRLHSAPVARRELRVEGLSKVFTARRGSVVTAVDDVSFRVLPGEVCALLGPSGCGKSTVLRMVAGLEQPSDGSIVLSGREVTGPGRDRGLVFQSYTCFPWLTVRENVAYGLKVTGSTLALREGTVDYFLERVKLTPFADRYPDELSGGMRQRVAIARTLANGPDLLLMDEPFGALDSETRWQMQRLLLDVVRREGMSVLIVTHDVDEALYLADKIVCLSRHPGRVRDILMPPAEKPDEPEALYSAPAFVRLRSGILRMLREEGATAPLGETP